MAIPILVTGGAGYIGSHTCKALAAAGFLPIAYDNLSTGHAYAVKWGPFVQGDLFDQAKLLETFDAFHPQAVLHFAASALVIESMHNPELYYRNNVAGTLSLLEAMRKKGLFRLVFSSTCATYGNPIHLPMTEEHPQAPINPYGRTKLMIEQMLSDFSNVYGLKTAVLRYFNAAGADGDTEIGENHTPETHLVPSIIQTALGLKPEVAVYGTNFPTRDGSAIRDYIHVSDLADAHVLALKYLLTEKDPLTLNLGTGNGCSVLELIEQIQKKSGKELPVRFEPSRPGEPHTLMASAAKAKELLGWIPHRSSLPNLIESAWKWHSLLLEQTPIVRSTMQRMEEKLNL
jgi:UDP-glucose-4-epimerase GalE